MALLYAQLLQSYADHMYSTNYTIEARTIRIKQHGLSSNLNLIPDLASPCPNFTATPFLNSYIISSQSHFTFSAKPPHPSNPTAHNQTLSWKTPPSHAHLQRVLTRKLSHLKPGTAIPTYPSTSSRP